MDNTEVKSLSPRPIFSQKRCDIHDKPIKELIIDWLIRRGYRIIYGIEAWELLKKHGVHGSNAYRLNIDKIIRFNFT